MSQQIVCGSNCCSVFFCFVLFIWLWYNWYQWFDDHKTKQNQQFQEINQLIKIVLPSNRTVFSLSLSEFSRFSCKNRKLLLKFCTFQMAIEIRSEWWMAPQKYLQYDYYECGQFQLKKNQLTYLMHQSFDSVNRAFFRAPAQHLLRPNAIQLNRRGKWETNISIYDDFRSEIEKNFGNNDCQFPTDTMAIRG